MSISQGFWSYVHDDDSAEGGRISDLARHIVDQYNLLTGEEIHLLFLDKDNIEWGDQWRQIIDSNLASVAFFIPVMTPRYFKSPECRRELQSFLRKAKDLGIQELILPLHYVNVPALYDEATEDDLIKLLSAVQWEDWRELRLVDVSSGEYRRSVAKLAQKIVDVNKRIEEAAPLIPAQLEEATNEDGDDTPGTIDTLANSEDKLMELPGTLEAITEEFAHIVTIMEEATEKIQRGDEQGKGFAARLIVARQTASLMSEPTERIFSLSNEYASHLHSIDSGIRLIIARAPIEISEDPSNQEHFCALFNNIRELSDASKQATQGFVELLSSAETLEKLSRDLRPALRQQKQGLTILIESSKVIQEWVRLIDEIHLGC